MSNHITGGAVFLRTLAAAGITHVFVNWGNDHPSFLEELEQERLANGGKNALEIITAPNEMVALSAAHGYAQQTGKPAALIVHVDVGTQGLGAAIHNADKGRVPVLIFSGAAPYSGQGELKGSKNEWPMWGQDIPDQAAIVRQYMRYTAQFMSARTIAKVTLRALQFTTSQPKGPVYLYGRREVLEEEISDSLVNFSAPNLNPSKWPSVTGGGLPPEAVTIICKALSEAKFPLLVTGGTDRNPRTIPLLHRFTEALAIAVFTACPIQTCVSYSHPTFLGSSYGGKNPLLDEADVILILEADLPWVAANGNEARPDAKVFVIDSDPLKPGMTWAHIDADFIYQADAETALPMLIAAVGQGAVEFNAAAVENRRLDLKKRHDEWISSLETIETTFNSTVATAANAYWALKLAVDRATQSFAHSQGRKPGATIWLNETASNLPSSFNHIRMTDEDINRGSSAFVSGGSGLGWILGAAIGVQMGGATKGGKSQPELTVVVVGDGTFIFSIPTAAYWMARRYNTPFLTVVLNNGGWASPKASMMGVYPTGDGSRASGNRLTVGLGPVMVDFGGIAAAAGGAWSGRAKLDNMTEVFEQAARVVLEEKRCAVVECAIGSDLSVGC